MEVFRQSDGWQYEKLGVLKHQTFNLLHRSFNVKVFIFSAICPIFYIACCAFVLFLLYGL